MQTGSSPRRAVLALMVAGCAAPVLVSAATPAAAPSMKLEQGITARISDHVYVIPSKGRVGVPNVGIIVGQRATLIVDTGLGTASGQVVLDEMRRISRNDRVYVASTHFHAEHLSGENAFPAQAQVVRARAEQLDIEAQGMQVIERFRSMSDENRTLLQGFAFRAPDIVFESQITLDLGGVSVDVMALGPAHTNGDTMFFVREDRVLFTGDIVQKRLTPIILGNQSTAQSWLNRLDEAEKLGARIVVPSHGELTDSSAIGENREALKFLQQRVSELKRGGTRPEAAGDVLVGEFKAKFPDWRNEGAIRMSIPRLYADPN
jgi:glyoxylase-like metal-dependent hydrolase (beta-lactamase superfamily II)